MFLSQQLFDTALAEKMGKLLAFASTAPIESPLAGSPFCGEDSQMHSPSSDQFISSQIEPGTGETSSSARCRAHQLMRARNLIARAAALVAPLGHGGERAGWMLEDCLDMLAEIDLEGVEPAASEEKSGSAASDPRKSRSHTHQSHGHTRQSRSHTRQSRSHTRQSHSHTRQSHGEFYESTNLSNDRLEQIECTALSQLYAELCSTTLCSTPEAFLPIEASTESNIIPFSRSL